MPVIDGFDFILPPELQNADGKTVSKRLMYSGTAGDGRVFTPEDLSQIYKDTKAMAETNGRIVKVKITHEQGTPGSNESEEMSGFLKRLEMRVEGNGAEEAGTLWGDMHLFPDTYIAFSNGRFPEVSIGAMVATDREGNMYEKPLDHVALLGAQRAALSGFIFNSIQNSVSKIKQYFSSEQGNTKEINLNMDKINIQNIGQLVEPIKELASFANTMSLAVSQLSGQGTEDTKKEPELPVEPKTELAAISPSEITKAFNSLVHNGNLKQDSREKFDSLVEITNSIEKSVQFYSDNKVVTPPTGTELASDRDETGLAAKTKGIQEAAAKMKKAPFSKEDIEKVVNATVEV